MRAARGPDVSARRAPGGGGAAALLAPALVTGLALAAGLAGCSHGFTGRTAGTASPPHVDSATVALWRMDEPGGFNVADEGPFRLAARAGGDTGTDFGRFRGARTFTHSIDSFLYVPFSTAYEVGSEITVEAWIEPVTFGNAELMPIVARWTPIASEQSWIFGIVGLNLQARSADSPIVGSLNDLVALGSAGRLVFAFQPVEASPPVSYFTLSTIELNRWTHVAATFDGHEVRFYIDGRLDSQYAFGSRLRASQAPLLVGNYFDTRWITDLGDRPTVGAGVDRNAYYAFEGKIDELRLSRGARTEFWPAR